MEFNVMKRTARHIDVCRSSVARVYQTTKVLVNLRRLITALAFVGAAALQPAGASESNEYCFPTADTCYTTLAEAEAAMRARSEYGQLGPELVLNKTVVTGAGTPSPGLLKYYHVLPEGPAFLYPSAYEVGGHGTDYGCASAGEPYPRRCASEQEAIENFYARYSPPSEGCTVTPFIIKGNYAEPFVHISRLDQSKYPRVGQISSGAKWIEFTTNCPWFNDDTLTSINKVTAFKCREGFSIVSGWSVVAQPPGELHATNMCTAPHFYLPPVIYVRKVHQVRSCPVNAHPCHPSTGDKSRTEDDFVFADRSFQRFYHSLRELDGSGVFGAGWSHTYSGSLDIPGRNMTSHDGYFSKLVYLGNGKYRLEDSSSTLVQALAGGGADVYFQNGDVRRFNQAGNLIQVRNVERPGDDLTLIYSLKEGKQHLSEITDATGRRLELHYTDSRVDRITVGGERQFSYAYDAASNLASVSTDAEVIRAYNYGEADAVVSSNPHLLTGITEADGMRYATFKYDAQDRVVYSGLHSGSTMVATTDIRYVAPGAAEVVLASGEMRTYNYASNLYRNLNSVVSSSGSEVSRYDASGRLWQVVDEGGRTTEFLYSDSELRSVTNAVGTPVERRIEFDRDAISNQVSERRSYNSSGTLVARRVFMRNVRGQIASAAEYDPVQNTSRVIQTTYCEEADLAAGKCPVLGLVLSVDGRRTDVADVTHYTYYSSNAADCEPTPSACAHRKGDLWKVTNALGHISENVRYDGVGRVLSVKDTNGVITDMEYHPRGWLTARKVRGADDSSEFDDRITRIEYELTGLVKKTTLPDGSYTSFTYDAAHRLTAIIDGEGNRIQYVLDNAGNKIKEDTIGHNGTVMRTLSRVYNQLGQLQTAADAHYNPTDFVYDADGNIDTVTDAYGRVSDSGYDPLGRLTQTIQDIGGINATTQFEYDAQDNLTAVVDPKSLTTRYTYNGLGELTNLSSPDTGATTYTYDSAGNRKTQIDARSELTTYDYDALNRLTSIGYSTPELNVTYTYDMANAVCDPEERFSSVGRLAALTDASGSTQYCYDRFGQLTRKVQTTNGTVLTLRYAYTKAGQLSGITYPDGTFVDYQRDALGRTTSVGVASPGGARQVLLHEATYYPFGPIAEWVFGNGRLFQRTLNQNYQPGVVQDGFPGGLSLGYEFDAVGNLSTLRNGDQTDPPQRLFGYDALNRLTEAKDGATGALLQGYTYDATGNRQSSTSGTATTDYTTETDSHRLTAVGTVARSYDAAGSTTSIGGTERQFVYDAAGRMSQVLRNNVLAMNYRYNGKGEQVQRSGGSVNARIPSGKGPMRRPDRGPPDRNGKPLRGPFASVDTYTMYDEAGHWLGDYDSTGAPIQQAIWLDDLPVGVIAGGNLHYIEADHLGTPRVVIDPQRDVAVWHWELTGEAFGDSTPNQDPDGDANAFVFNMRFPGQRYDVASGLNYNYFRDYEPGTGRYVESDPIGQRGGMATFAYSNGSPLTTWDFYGLQPSLSEGPVTSAGVLGWVSCNRGNISAVVVDKNVQRYYGDCAGPIRECIQVHEETHIRDARRLSPSICSERFWEPAYWRTSHLTDPSNWGRRATEFRAHAAQLRCLTSKLREVGQCNRRCRRTILRAIRDTARNIPYISNGEYGLYE